MHILLKGALGASVRRGSAPTGAAVLIVALAGCGYRPAVAALPAGVREVLVRPPVAHAVHEPELARMLATELVRQLSRAGVRASSRGGAAATLRGQLLSLATVETPLAPGRRLAGRVLRLRLELALEDATGTLWRSGALEVDELAPLSAVGAGPSEAARRMALSRLALRAAERAVELLTSGL